MIVIHNHTVPTRCCSFLAQGVNATENLLNAYMNLFSGDSISIIESADPEKHCSGTADTLELFEAVHAIWGK